MNSLFRHNYDIIPVLNSDQLIELMMHQLILSNIVKCPSVQIREQIPELLNRLGLNGKGIEIGVYTGQYSEVILSKSNLSKLYICDVWKHLEDYNDSANADNIEQETRFRETITKLSKFKGRVEILRMFSNEAVKKFDDSSLDFVYIDANHAHKYVMEDVTNWYPKVKSGGIISGHDFVDNDTFGVRSAVIKYFENFPTIYITSEKYGDIDWPSWFLIKK